MGDDRGTRAWQRASACESGHCVEVSRDRSEVLVRNSAEPVVTLRFTDAEWEAFRRGMAAGEFDAL